MVEKKLQNTFTANNFFNALLMGTMIVFLWFFAGFTVDYFTYLKKANYSIAETFDWGVVEFSDDKYVVCVDFRFHTDGTEEYVSQHLFENTPYRYEEAANQAIEEMKKTDLKCYWYGSSKDPRASLERSFPYKSGLYSFIIFGVYAYFYFLRRKILKQTSL